VPGAQAAHADDAVAATMVDSVPSAHGVQLAVPKLAAKFPAEHAAQLAARAGEYRPTAQFKQ
jgi:hypothetical protein